MKTRRSGLLLVALLAVAFVAEILAFAPPVLAGGGDSGGCAGGAVYPNCSAGTCNGSKVCTNQGKGKACKCV